MFMTPGLPFVPAIAVMVNIYLIFKLSILTLVRFTLWMIVGKHTGNLKWELLSRMKLIYHPCNRLSFRFDIVFYQVVHIKLAFKTVSTLLKTISEFKFVMIFSSCDKMKFKIMDRKF